MCSYVHVNICIYLLFHYKEFIISLLLLMLRVTGRVPMHYVEDPCCAVQPTLTRTSQKQSL